MEGRTRACSELDPSYLCVLATRPDHHARGSSQTNNTPKQKNKHKNQKALRSEVVEPGCVTPLALANASTAGGTVLLLDARLRGAGVFAVHPIVNTTSVLLNTDGLDAFLK